MPYTFHQPITTMQANPVHDQPDLGNALDNAHDPDDNQDPLYTPFPYNLFPNPHDVNHIDEEPLYVNAKQYFRILKRRVARTRLEELHRLSRQRKVFPPFSITPSIPQCCSL